MRVLGYYYLEGRGNSAGTPLDRGDGRIMRNMPFFLLCLAGAIQAKSASRFAAVDLRAQQSDPGQPTLTVRSTLVQVPVLVKTKSGKVIFGLTAGDFAAVSRQAKLAGAEGDARAILSMLERELLLRRRGSGSGRAIGFEPSLEGQAP